MSDKPDLELALIQTSLAWQEGIRGASATASSAGLIQLRAER